MYKYYLVILLLLLVPSTYADQLDGLDGLATVFILIPIGVILAIILLISSIHRFTTKPHKVNKTLNFSGIVLIMIAFFAIATIGLTSIDPGFLATCIGVSILSGVLVILNNKLVDKD